MPRSYRGSIHRRGWAVLRAEGHDIRRTRLSWLTLCILLSVLWTPCVWPFTSLQWRKQFFLACFFVGCAVIRPVEDRPASSGRGQGRTPSQSPARQTGSRSNPVMMNVSKSIPDCTDPWTDTSLNCWPLDEHHFAEVFAVCSSIQTDDPPLWIGFLHRWRCSPPRKPGPLFELLRRLSFTQAM